jgi:hypothetical protein
MGKLTKNPLKVYTCPDIDEAMRTLGLVAEQGETIMVFPNLDSALKASTVAQTALKKPGKKTPRRRPNG